MYCSLARFACSVFVWYDMSFQSSLAAKLKTYMYVCYNLNTFTGTLIFAYPFLFVWYNIVLQRQYGLRIISFDENNFNIPITKHSCFMCLYTTLFQHFKTCSQEGNPGLYLHPGSAQALVLLCISAMTYSLQSYVQRRFGSLFGCIIVLRPFDTF